MVNQYKNEMSQVHAPADLIRRTKEAVQAEEERLQRGQADFRDEAQLRKRQDDLRDDMQLQKMPDDFRGDMQLQKMPDDFRGDMQAQRKQDGLQEHDRASIRKWAALLTAAAAVIVLVSVSAVTQRDKSDSSTDMAFSGGYEDSAMEAAADDGYENNMAMQFGEAEASEMEPEFLPESTEPAAGAPMEASDTGGTTEEQAEVPAVEMTEVSEYPDYYLDRKTEIVPYRGLRFSVAQDEEGGWHAFVNTEDGMFAFDGKAASQEEFLEAAYQLLQETRE